MPSQNRPILTLILIAIMTGIFFIEPILPIQDLALIPATVAQTPWTMVTSIFLHWNLQHIFFNMFALFFFGIALESRIGWKSFLLVFLISGIFGSIGFMLTAPDPTTAALGASGAIYGIIGTLLIIAPFAMVWAGFIPMPMFIAGILYGATEILGLFGPASDIAHGAHVGGLFFGIAYGFYLRWKFSRENVLLVK